MDDSKDHKAAAEPPLDCNVGRDVVVMLRERAARKWTDDANRSASLFGRAADEIERLRALKQPAMPTRDEIIKLWDLAMLETATELDAMEYFTRAVLVPNASNEGPAL